jgi:hypothetical protein
MTPYRHALQESLAATFAAVAPPTRWVEQLTNLITATQIRLAVAIALGLAAANFFYLGLTTAQIGASVDSTDPTTDDTIDVGSSASWQCAGVPIATPCGTAR